MSAVFKYNTDIFWYCLKFNEIKHKFNNKNVGLHFIYTLLN